MSKTKPQPDARQRVLETAERLFYAEGVRSVGIDRIIAEAGVAKMTLYNHFASKDALILAVLKFREENFNEYLEVAMGRYEEKGMRRLEAFFAALKQWFQTPGFRGCSFINASVELADARHPASMFSAEHKQKFHEMLTQIVTDSAGTQAASAAEGIALLVEGAIVTAVMEGRPEVADVARDAALALVSKAKRR